ncbi:PKD domain-containing protein [Solirubrobacter sp. CPCC 204708]|uniref:PKD domain-containing protein n=1 Tax=Solirubrobacter deserti TaxID=2282478 RepID=A0ABT4RJB0_9ACTN|nr:PKD domain-containing protein [Solirubrobacter deserti]MBE2317691.1 PKD domain-containing protein [Solirubrobacter deserti]MDA0138642.1 PKD domain-containing protein [Solirubrobacter deserti]
MARKWIGLVVALLTLGAMAPAAASAQDTAKVLIYSGTTGYRHAGSSEAIQPAVVELIQAKLQAAGVASDYRTCSGHGTGSGTLPGCRNTTVGNPAIFTPANLAQYDAIFFWQASSLNRGDTTSPQLFTVPEQQAIEAFARAGGGIAAMHASVTMGAGAVTWPWWDGPGDSAIGALMPGHSATDSSNIATVEVSDRHHPSTKDLPDSYRFGDEHYTFSSNVRGTHHVLMTLDEESYNVGNGVTRMGADHPIAWCRMYEGARIWSSSLGHFSAAYLENGGDNNLLKHLVGGVRYVAGLAGKDSDCGATVWTNFSRTVLADDLRGAIGMDIARDGKVYWTEIGNQAINSEGRLRMWNPQTKATSTLLTLPTRADHESSNDGVLGMALDPDFATNRRLYIYYSPRQDPGCNSCLVVGHNVISRFTLNAEGTGVVAGSEQEILRVPKVKVGNDNEDGIAGQNTYSAHVGGGSLSFDSEGNLYIGTGDDVDPFGAGGNGYAPMDQRYPERYDARNTSANTNDLRGKILRVKPLANAAGAAGAGTTYAIPAGNMFPVGTAKTKPEIFAMGFRNPFTVAADPAHPGTVVVGDYGPDAATNSTTRGPAGIIEWNRVTKPGFYGWPLCAGDNSTANTYNRYTFPNGPSGERFNCGAATIPNESPNQSGLTELPGPAIGADVWHKRTGDHPARFGIPARTSPQESITGPIYKYDASNPSDTKWPAYFDGAWLMLDRAQNWWREARVRDNGSSLLRVNGLFGSSQFGSPSHSYPIPVKFGPDGSLYLATWDHDCCRAQLPSSQPGRLMRIDFIGDQVDTTAPVLTPTLTGGQNPSGAYLGRATLTLNATDQSGISRIEYSLDGTEWTRYTAPVGFTDRGSYTVRVRAVDRANNTSEVQQVTFTVVAGAACTPARSDEFDGTLNTTLWSYRHATTPATGTRAPSVSGGNLVLPLGAFSVDLTRPGPIGFLGQPLPTGDFTMVAKLSAPGLNADNSGEGSKYAQAGVKIFQGNDNWIKLAHNRNADGNPTGAAGTYFELSQEVNGTRTLGTRTGLGTGNLPTWWVRLVRTGDQVAGAYSLTDPESAGGANWVALGSANLNTVLPEAGGPRYIGVYGGNGSVNLSADYVRFTPDSPKDLAPPVSSHTVPAADGLEGWHRTPVNVTVSAADDGECVSGIDTTEYRVGGGAFAAYTAPIALTADGTHTVEYRSTDKAGNAETAKSVTVKLDATAPATTASTNPTGAGPHPAPVTLTLDAADAASGVKLTEYRVNHGGAFAGVAPKALSAAADWLPYSAAGKPAFTANGTYSIEYRSTDVAGNVEATKTVTFTVGTPTGDATAPVTSAALDPASPGPGRVYPGPVTVKFSALDLAPAENKNVDANGTVWTPAAISLNAGDTVTWRFGATAGSAHDVWLVPPGGNPSPDGPDIIKASEIVFPGGAPVTRALTQTGTWRFICRLHAGFTDGAWTGMVGTATVGAGAGSGVDFTEYRVNGGAWTRAANTAGASPFASQALVSAEGEHTVEFRSGDKAGNLEAAKSIAFGIDVPDPGFPQIEAFADPNVGAAPLPVRFSASGFDPDGSALSYRWQFPGGATVHGRTVERTFTQPGTYTVKVTATDAQDEQTSREVTVSVTAPGVLPPTVEATSSVTGGAARLPVTFTATGADPDGDPAQLKYAWDFGDGGKSLNPNPTHVYGAPGVFDATVTVTDPSGATATKTIKITVTDAPGNGAPTVEEAYGAAGFDGDPMAVQFSARATDPDGDKLTLEWDFDDGTAKGSGTSVKHTYTTPGTYDATVTASDGTRTSQAFTVRVTVARGANRLPQVTIEADPTTGPGPLTVRFSSDVVEPDGEGYSRAWAFGDGGNSAEAHPAHEYKAAGTYTATLTVTDERGGVTTKSVQVTVTAVQAAPPAAPKTADAAPAPEPAPWFGVSEPVRTSVSGFAKRGLAVRVTCTQAMRGTAKLTLAASMAKRLGLKRTTLASAPVKCAGAGSQIVTLRPSAATRRALGKAKGAVKLKLGVSLSGRQASRTVTLTRG